MNTLLFLLSCILHVGQNGCVSPAPAARSSPRGRPGSCPHHKYEPCPPTSNSISYWPSEIKRLTAKGCTTLKNVFSFLGPPNITAKPTDPPAAPSLNFTVARTQAPAGPPTTLAPTVIPVTTITTTTTTPSPAGEGDVQPAGPNGTGRVLPVPPPPPPAPTDAPQPPPSSGPAPPPTPVGADNGTTTYALDTPTPETYFIEDDTIDVETETTTEPGMGFTSDTTPHGECFVDNQETVCVCLFNMSTLKHHPQS